MRKVELSSSEGATGIAFTGGSTCFTSPVLSVEG